MPAVKHVHATTYESFFIIRLLRLLFP
jgi:hypothetical protein